MNIEEVQAYISLLKESGLAELDVKTTDFEIHLKMPQTQVTYSSGQTVGYSEIAPQSQPIPTNQVDVGETQSSSGIEVKTPIVGIAYLTPEPGSDPFVQVGSIVKKGDKLAIISAMKVMNDLLSPVDGIVKSILVSNEDVVEFDQPLFIIE